MSDTGSVEEGVNDSVIPVAVLMLVGICISVVNYSLSNHSNSIGKAYHDLYLMPGIVLLVASGFRHAIYTTTKRLPF